jgi:hypothetical protein
MTTVKLSRKCPQPPAPTSFGLIGPMVIVGEGLRRIVGQHPSDLRVVYKFPRVEPWMKDICCCGKADCACYGEADNFREAELSAHYGDKPDINGIVYARCEILEGTTVLMMEAVDTNAKGRRPKWADYIDGGQVGRAVSDGRWVAYDFGFGH